MRDLLDAVETRASAGGQPRGVCDR